MLKFGMDDGSGRVVCVQRLGVDERGGRLKSLHGPGGLLPLSKGGRQQGKMAGGAKY